jgi:PAS domain S-box-containing protein
VPAGFVPEVGDVSEYLIRRAGDDDALRELIMASSDCHNCRKRRQAEPTVPVRSEASVELASQLWAEIVDVRSRAGARGRCDTSAMAEPLLDEIADELPVAVAVLGRDGYLRYANPALADRLGQAPGCLTGRSLDETLGSPGSFVALSQVASGEEVELSCRRTDGTGIWLLASCRPMDCTEARVAVFSDATERHRIEAEHGAQTAALARLAELPEKNPGPVGRLTLDADVLMANAAARRFTGEGNHHRRAASPGSPNLLYRTTLNPEVQFDGPVLLVDDTTRTRWTATVAGPLLADAGATSVLPLVVHQLP